MPFAKSAYLWGVEVETGEKPRMLLRTARDSDFPWLGLPACKMGRWAGGQKSPLLVRHSRGVLGGVCENLPVTMRSATLTSGERQGQGMVGALPCHWVARSETGSAADCCPIWGQ